MATADEVLRGFYTKKASGKTGIPSPADYYKGQLFAEAGNAQNKRRNELDRANLATAQQAVEAQRAFNNQSLADAELNRQAQEKAQQMQTLTNLGGTALTAYGLSDSHVIGDTIKSGVNQAVPSVAKYLGIDTMPTASLTPSALSAATNAGAVNAGIGTATGTGSIATTPSAYASQGLGTGAKIISDPALMAGTESATTQLAPASSYVMGGGEGATGAAIGEATGTGASTVGSGGGASIVSRAVPIAAIIAGAEMARNQWGGAGIPYKEKTKQQRVVDSPGTAGVMASVLPGALAAPEGTVLGRAGENMSALERTAMAPIDYVFGNKDAFNKETLNTATNALLNPFSDADDPSTAGQIANAVFNPIGAIGNLFCFAFDTPMQMADGKEVPVQDLDLLDTMLEGGNVMATGKALSENIYSYKGILVEGHHAVFSDGEWKRVQDCPDAKFHGSGIVYPVVNEHHLIIVDGIVFADMVETPLGWDVSDRERIDWLNSQTKRNELLKERYENSSVSETEALRNDVQVMG